MRSYEDLTPLGKLRRIRQMARMALKAFGFPNAHLRLIVDSGNIMHASSSRCSEDRRKSIIKHALAVAVSR